MRAEMFPETANNESGVPSPLNEADNSDDGAKQGEQAKDYGNDAPGNIVLAREN